MQENEIEERGITIGEIFRIIFSRKWLALIIAAVITLAGTLGLYFWGQSKAEYTVTFAMLLPGSDNSPVNYKYPDGTYFHYTDIISSENVAGTAEKFSGINTAKMLKSGDITIERVLTETVRDSGNYDADYKISVKQKYFDSEEQAEEFISGLIRLPEKHIAEMQIDYGDNLDSAESALTFDDQLGFLQLQVNKLRSGYSSFISAYGANYVVENGKTLEGYRTNIDAFLKSANSIDVLKAELISNHYIKSEQALTKYENDLVLKQRDLKIKQDTLDSIDAVDSSKIVTGLAEYIALSNEIGQLKYDIEDLTNYIENGVTGGAALESFKNKVRTLQTAIGALTEEYAAVAQTVYTNETSSYPSEISVVSEGGLGVVKSLIISLVVGIVIAMIVAYIAGSVKIKKNRKAQTDTLTVTEAQAQAAAAKDDEGTD